MAIIDNNNKVAEMDVLAEVNRVYIDDLLAEILDLARKYVQVCEKRGLCRIDC